MGVEQMMVRLLAEITTNQERMEAKVEVSNKKVEVF
jgi:hypothetical protein